MTPSRRKPDRGFVTLKSRTLNQKGEVLQLQTSKLLVWRRKGRLYKAKLRIEACWTI